MFKELACVSLFIVVIGITSIKCDVSHIALGAESSVDTETMAVLKRNISDYLVELEHSGSPQMQLKQIFSATKQIVTGTVYTVHALLETADGSKHCEISVLEKPWLDFCQVRVKCENGGQYEVTFNPHHNTAAYVDSSPAKEVDNDLNAHVLNIPELPQIPSPFTTRVDTSNENEIKPQSAPSFNFVPEPHTAEVTPQSNPLFDVIPETHELNVESIPTFDSELPTNHQSEHQSVSDDKLNVEPIPRFDSEVPTNHQSEHQSVSVHHGIPTPVFPKAPEINILPFDQLPQGQEFETYLRGLFNEFMQKYNRHYIDEATEKEYRFGVFTENFHTMHEHALADTLACQYSVTEFSDLTKSEFERITGFDTSIALNFTGILTEDISDSSEGAENSGHSGSSESSGHSGSSGSLEGSGSSGSSESSGSSGSSGSSASSVSSKSFDATASGEIPEKYDQRDENLVTRIKFQGDCGACWAFVTTAVIEGLCAKRIKQLQEFSEQSLIDCDNSNFGCKGGVPPNAMKHIAKRGGLELEAVYPYLFSKQSCHFDSKTVRVKVAGVVGFKKGDEKAMAKWLFKNGPILVGINADPLQFYKGGVLNPTKELCSPKKINHGVTLIGYGVELNTSTGEKLPYWIVKNQWGTRFGEDGYFRIARGKNACGLALWASSAKLADISNNCLLEGA